MNSIITMGEICRLAMRELLRQRETEEKRTDSKIKIARLYKIDKKIDYLKGQIVMWEKSEQKN